MGEATPAASRAPAIPAAPATAGAGLPAPRLADVRTEDLRDPGRVLELHRQAVARGLVGASEADRLKFAAAAEHARSVGTINPGGLFASLVRRGWWHFATQADEDAASARLKRHLFGKAGGAVVRPGVGPRPAGPSADALLVREVRAAVARAGGRMDPFPLVRAKDPSWTRERWDRASAELEGGSGAGIGSGLAGLGWPWMGGVRPDRGVHPGGS